MREYTKSKNLKSRGKFHLNLLGGVIRDPFEQHTHDFHELLIIFSGRGIHRLEGSEWSVGRGDIFVIPPGKRHDFPRLEKLELLNVMFDPEEMGSRWDRLRNSTGFIGLFQVEPLLRGSRETVPLRLPPEDLSFVKDLTRELSEAFREYDNPLTDSLLHALCHYLSRRFDDMARKERDTELYPLARGAAFLRTHWSDPDVSVEQAAVRAGLSRRHFTRLFSGAYGKGPHRFLLDLRLERAARLLIETELTVTETAFACGFNDGNYFSRVFSRHWGCPPREWRSGEETCGQSYRRAP